MEKDHAYVIVNSCMKEIMVANMYNEEMTQLEIYFLQLKRYILSDDSLININDIMILKDLSETVISDAKNHTKVSKLVKKICEIIAPGKNHKGDKVQEQHF